MENFEENKHEAENREENEIKITEQNIDMIRKSLEQHEQEDAPLAIINENVINLTKNKKKKLIKRLNYLFVIP